MIHAYMRAIGFSGLSDRAQLNRLISESVQKASEHSGAKKDNGIMIGEFDREYADRIGLAVCGEFDPQSRFVYEYYFPYVRGTCISSEEDVTVYRLSSKEAYSGICDDYRVGVSIIFYLQNMTSYIRALAEEEFPVRGTTLTLSALSIEGTVIMPIYKSEEDIEYIRRREADRSLLISEARNGDETAIESLTLEDMDNYSVVSKRILNEDVFSLVDSYFMPFGVESDQYSVLGEIEEVTRTVNRLTGENLYILLVACNGLKFDVCMNAEDLMGEPAVGRRFKGIIWMQGFINFNAD